MYFTHATPVARHQERQSDRTDCSKTIRQYACLLFFFVTALLCAHALAATDAPCNTATPWVNPSYNNITATRTTNCPALVLGSFITVGANSNLVDADLNTAASVNVTGLNCSVTYSAQDTDAADTYLAGYFAGFRIGAAGLTGAIVSATVRIETYNNGVLVEGKNVVSSGASLDASAVDGSGQATVGFITTQAFDEVRIKYTSLILTPFNLAVYHPVIEKFCAGSAL